MVTAMDAVRVDEQDKTAYVVFAVPGEQDARTIERGAHETLVSRRPVLRGDARIVESMVAPPGGLNWHGRWVPAGGWVGAVKFGDAGWRNVRDLLKPGSDATTNGGGEPMDTRDKVFSDAVRGIVPEKPETIDAELILLRQVVTEALRPLIFQLEELASRVRRVTTSIRAPDDPFGQAVRGGPLTAAEQLAQKRRAERDPFGTAVREVRPTLVVGHRFLRDKRRR